MSKTLSGRVIKVPVINSITVDSLNKKENAIRIEQAIGWHFLFWKFH